MAFENDIKKNQRFKWNQLNKLNFGIIGDAHQAGKASLYYNVVSPTIVGYCQRYHFMPNIPPVFATDTKHLQCSSSDILFCVLPNCVKDDKACYLLIKLINMTSGFLPILFFCSKAGQPTFCVYEMFWHFSLPEYRYIYAHLKLNNRRKRQKHTVVIIMTQFISIWKPYFCMIRTYRDQMHRCQHETIHIRYKTCYFHQHNKDPPSTHYVVGVDMATVQLDKMAGLCMFCEFSLDMTDREWSRYLQYSWKKWAWHICLVYHLAFLLSSIVVGTSTYLLK